MHIFTFAFAFFPPRPFRVILARPEEEPPHRLLQGETSVFGAKKNRSRRTHGGDNPEICSAFYLLQPFPVSFHSCRLFGFYLARAQVLEIVSSATEDEIKKAYRKAALRRAHHSLCLARVILTAPAGLQADFSPGCTACCALFLIGGHHSISFALFQVAPGQELRDRGDAGRGREALQAGERGDF